MTVGRCALEYMRSEGVKYFFGIPGGHINPLFDELFDFSEDIRTILVKHEQNASFMADGYYRASHQVAVCGGTVGPGVANIIAGLHVPYQDSIPVLAIGANIRTDEFGKGSIQHAEGWGRSMAQVDLARPVTKWSVMLPQSHLMPEVMKRAFKIMLSGRMGPVYVDVPTDLFTQKIAAEILPTDKYRTRARAEADPALVQKVATLLIEADRPAILSGAGVMLSEASEDLRELAELLSLPVATTLMGKSTFPEDHQLALGVVGRCGVNGAANARITPDKTDVLLGVGCTFHAGTTMYWAGGFGAEKVIQIDIDPTEIGNSIPIDVGVVGDAKLVLRQIVNHVKAKISKMGRNELKDLEDKKRRGVRETLKSKNEYKYFNEPESFDGSVPIKPQTAVRTISDFADDDAIFWSDCGSNITWAGRYLKATGSRMFLADGGHTHMGFSVPASIGAKLAAPDRQVIDVVGDGSFQMHCNEVLTAAAYNIKVIWCILDDASLGLIKQAQKFAKVPERYIASSLYNMDFEKYAEACHVFSRTVERPGEIEDALKEAVDSDKPAIVDIKIDPDELSPFYMERFKSTVQRYPHLLTKRMPVPEWPQEYDVPIRGQV